MDGRVKGEGRGRSNTTHVMRLISPVKGRLSIPFISLSWESDSKKDKNKIKPPKTSSMTASPKMTAVH